MASWWAVCFAGIVATVPTQGYWREGVRKVTPTKEVWCNGDSLDAVCDCAAFRQRAAAHSVGDLREHSGDWEEESPSAVFKPKCDKYVWEPLDINGSRRNLAEE